MSQCSFAEVEFDGTRGTNGFLSETNGVYTIDQASGETVGNNVFHSFTQFNVESGNTALFTASAGTENIISRVTGGNASQIDGSITSDVAGANLWLFNPNGVMFGKGASVDVQGSFFVSTADNLHFLDNGSYTADNSADVLSADAPESFNVVASAVPERGAIHLDQTQMQVGDGESLAIIGGDVDVQSSQLRAPNGNIDIVSISDTGEVMYTDTKVTSVTADSFGSVNVKFSALLADDVNIHASEITHDTGDAVAVKQQKSLSVELQKSAAKLDKHCSSSKKVEAGAFEFVVQEKEAGTEYFLKRKAVSSSQGCEES